MIREFSAIILRHTSQCTEPRGYQLEDIFNLNLFYFRCAFLVFFQKRTSGSERDLCILSEVEGSEKNQQCDFSFAASRGNCG